MFLIINFFNRKNDIVLSKTKTFECDSFSFPHVEEIGHAVIFGYNKNEINHDASDLIKWIDIRCENVLPLDIDKNGITLNIYVVKDLQIKK
jgi:hypothetical protein